MRKFNENGRGGYTTAVNNKEIMVDTFVSSCCGKDYIGIRFNRDVDDKILLLSLGEDSARILYSQLKKCLAKIE